MYRYTAERVIQRSLDAVFAYLEDVTRQPDWVHGVTACHWQGAPGPRPGAIALQDMTFMGKRRTVPVTIADYVQQRRIVFEKDTPFRIRFGFEVESEGEATRVRYPVEMEPRGLLRVVISLAGRRTINGDLRRIAAHLEAAA